MSSAAGVWRASVWAGAALAGALAAHSVVNARLLLTPEPGEPAEPVREPVAVLVPARDEAGTVGAVVADLLSQQGLADLQVLVLDDGSTDGTAEILAGIRDDRLSVITSPDAPPPAGWLGKPWACQRLAQAVGAAGVLVFADADVRFEPRAVAAAVALLRGQGLAMVAPAPRQEAVTWMERLTQPLLAWSWLSTMPLRWSQASLRPSLVAANGQFLVVDAAAYWEAGGHAQVRGAVMEDIALARAVRAAGGHTATADGTDLARARMYHCAREVIDGYTKSLWSAFGGPYGSAGVVGVLALGYLIPPVAVVVGPTRGLRGVGLAGYCSGVIGRLVTGRRTGDRLWPDALAHPISIAVFGGLNLQSWRRHRTGANRWKGRVV